jgi:hypothetical protein
MNPEGLLPAASVGNPDPNNPVDVVGAGFASGAPKKPNAGAGLGASGAEVAAGWPKVKEVDFGSSFAAGCCPNKKPPVAGLGSSFAAGCPNMKPPVAGLGSSFAPNVNDVDAFALPNSPVPAAGAGAVVVLCPKEKPEVAGLSWFAVVPNPPKAGAAVVVVGPFAFPNIPLVGAVFVLPKEPELALPNMPPLVPLVGAAGAKFANGFAFGCSCCCC